VVAVSVERLVSSERLPYRLILVIFERSVSGLITPIFDPSQHAELIQDAKAIWCQHNTGSEAAVGHRRSRFVQGDRNVVGGEGQGKRAALASDRQSARGQKYVSLSTHPVDIVMATLTPRPAPTIATSSRILYMSLVWPWDYWTKMVRVEESSSPPALLRRSRDCGCAV